MAAGLTVSRCVARGVEFHHVDPVGASVECHARDEPNGSAEPVEAQRRPASAARERMPSLR
jgi:hypothetical protein